jgi:hypothetical protein
VSRDQLEEGDARPRGEAGDMATNNDARADAAAGSVAATAKMRRCSPSAI